MSQEHKPLIRSSQHAEAQKLLERPFRHWLPFDPRAARRAADRGAPLSSAAASSPLSKAIAALGRDHLQTLAKPAAAAARAR
jgi:pilus assembly protein CpaE